MPSIDVSILRRKLCVIPHSKSRVLRIPKKYGKKKQTNSHLLTDIHKKLVRTNLLMKINIKLKNILYISFHVKLDIKFCYTHTDRRYLKIIKLCSGNLKIFKSVLKTGNRNFLQKLYFFLFT